MEVCPVGVGWVAWKRLDNTGTVVMQVTPGRLHPSYLYCSTVPDTEADTTGKEHVHCSYCTR